MKILVCALAALAFAAGAQMYAAKHCANVEAASKK